MEVPSSWLVRQERRHAATTRDFSNLDQRLTCIELSIGNLTSKVEAALSKLAPCGPESAVYDKLADPSGRIDRLELEAMQGRIDRLELLLFRAPLEDFEFIDQQLQAMRATAQPRFEELQHAGFDSEASSPRSGGAHTPIHFAVSCKHLLFKVAEKDEDSDTVPLMEFRESMDLLEKMESMDAIDSMDAFPLQDGLMTELAWQGPGIDQCCNCEVPSVGFEPVVLKSPVSSPRPRATVMEKSTQEDEVAHCNENDEDEESRLKSMAPDHQSFVRNLLQSLKQ